MVNEKPYDPSSHLSYDDLAVDDVTYPKAISIRIKYSKMDQERRGVNVVIGRSGNNLCPVSALLLYVSGQKRK